MTGQNIVHDRFQSCKSLPKVCKIVKRTTPGIPTWSPTVVQPGPNMLNWFNYAIHGHSYYATTAYPFQVLPWAWLGLPLSASPCRGVVVVWLFGCVIVIVWFRIWSVEVWLWEILILTRWIFTGCIFKFNLSVSHLQNYQITLTLSEYYYHLFQSVPSKTSQYYEWSVHMDGFACTEIISFFV